MAHATIQERHRSPSFRWRGPAAQSVGDDIPESVRYPLVGGRVLLLKRLEVIQHAVEPGQRQPRRTCVGLELLYLAD